VSLSAFTANALLEPDCYPQTPRDVELIQTQMSFVFLTGDYAYKVKKPVNLGYLDYTSLEKRYFFCLQEIKLNRRLCHNAYLSVVPIVEDKSGFRIEGEGRAVEYAVKMKQLPRDRMMDMLLSQGRVTQEMIAAVAEKLVGFHRKAKSDRNIAEFGKLDAIRQNTDENFAQTEKYIGVSISAENYKQIKCYTDSFIGNNSSLFDKRLEGERIRDCHGDLHAAHICFMDDICIYDCIEFNDRFRYCDVASEIAFLAMDLDRYNRPDLSQHLVDIYVGLSGDEELLALLGFYKCYRAYVRGKVESFKLDDPYIPEEEKGKALTAARRYFELAESYI
jgi:uncharacterized protein